MLLSFLATSTIGSSLQAQSDFESTVSRHEGPILGDLQWVLSDRT